MPEVTFPTGRFPTATGNDVVALGKVYIGEVDLDPTVLGNRIDVTIVQESGVSIVIPPASQPVQWFNFAQVKTSRCLSSILRMCSSIIFRVSYQDLLLLRLASLLTREPLHQLWPAQARYTARLLTVLLNYSTSTRREMNFK